MEFLKIAVAKGRIGNEASQLFKKIGIGALPDVASRKLIFDDEENQINYIHVKSVDVLTYVENGIADLGIVGKDIILETEADVYEIMDLGIGECRLVVAGPREQIISQQDQPLRVATRYPQVAKKYFAAKGQNIVPVKLNGSVELAPLLGLADVIVDLVQTGRTLAANNLTLLADVFPISARLVCNKISYRFKYERITEIIHLLQGGYSQYEGFKRAKLPGYIK